MTVRRQEKKHGWPDWLWIYEGAKSSSYWIRYRKQGIKIEQRLDVPFGAWTEARRLGMKLLAEAKIVLPDAETPIDLVRTEKICRELVALKLRKSDATYEQAEIFMRVHIIPYVNEHAPFARDLADSTHFDRYKLFKRLENPNVALFNHWKFWVQLTGYAFRRGLIPRPVKLDFNEEREDNRARGQVISDALLNRLLVECPQVWSDRILVQRFTGMRPGEVRKLHKSRFDSEKGIISLEKDDTKNREARSFLVRAPIVLHILRRRMKLAGSFFFMPRLIGKDQPMAAHLGGWNAALERAGLAEWGFTPHDLRHTFLTKEFKKPGANPALICYATGLSIEEAQKTYLHFTPEDTLVLADGLAKESLQLLGS